MSRPFGDDDPSGADAEAASAEEPATLVEVVQRDLARTEELDGTVGLRHGHAARARRRGDADRPSRRRRRHRAGRRDRRGRRPARRRPRRTDTAVAHPRPRRRRRHRRPERRVRAGGDGLRRGARHDGGRGVDVGDDGGGRGLPGRPRPGRRRADRPRRGRVHRRARCASTPSPACSGSGRARRGSR